MQLTFLGTRGNIKIRSKLHYMHSSLLITHENTSIIIDRGEDWLKRPFIPVDALFISHAHPDHVGGLAHGCPYPVFASLDTWHTIRHYPIKDPIVVTPRIPVTLRNLTIEPFFVYHSLHAPALGYRISTSTHALFYVPDLASIQEEQEALSFLDLYIGDGAIINRSLLLRKKKGLLTGHAPISQQLAWCHRYKVPRAIFTHCGTEIVSHDPFTIQARIDTITRQYPIPTVIAHDSMIFSL